MRFLVHFFLTFLLAFTGFAQTSSLTWNNNLNEAMQQAKESNKPLLVVFSGSDWCKPCIMLQQEVFEKAEFGQYAQDKLVLARFDFPRNKKNQLSEAQTRINEQAAAQLNKEGSFPMVVLLSPEGKVLAKTGYKPGGALAYTEHLNQLLSK